MFIKKKKKINIYYTIYTELALLQQRAHNLVIKIFLIISVFPLICIVDNAFNVKKKIITRRGSCKKKKTEKKFHFQNISSSSFDVAQQYNIILYKLLFPVNREN